MLFGAQLLQSAVLLGAQYSSLCSLVPIARVIEVWAPVGWAPSAWWAPSGVQAAGSCTLLAKGLLQAVQHCGEDCFG